MEAEERSAPGSGRQRQRQRQQQQQQHHHHHHHHPQQQQQQRRQRQQQQRQQRPGRDPRERDKWQDLIRLKPESQRRWDTIKIILRSITVICGLTLIALGAGLVHVTDLDNGGAGGFDGVNVLGTMIPAAFACLWAVAEFITIIVKRRRSGSGLAGIPPGAHVAVDLLLWLDNLIFFCILAGGLPSLLQGYSYYGTSETQIGLSISGLALQLALTGLHFTLFVRACMETERRNSEKQIRRAITTLRRQGVDLAEAVDYGRTNGGSRDGDDDGTHELSTLMSGSGSPSERAAQKKPATPHDSAHSDAGGGSVVDPAPADPEANIQLEDNMKFVMPASIIREMTGQKFTGMSPPDGEEKYPGLRRK